MEPNKEEVVVRETTKQADNSTVQRQSVERTASVSGVVIAQRIIWFIFGAISVVIAIRFVLLLLGANREAGFTDFIYSLSAPFVAPFVGIFGEPTYGTSVFEVSSLLAIAVYVLIAWGIAKLITLTRPHQEV